MLGVAPGPTRAPALNVPNPSGFNAITQAGAGLDNVGEQAYSLYQKQVHENEATEAANAVNQYRRASTETFLGKNTAPPSPVTSVGNTGSTTAPSDEAISAAGPKSFVIGMPDGSAGAAREPGFLDTKGDAAIPARDEALKKLEQRRQEIAASLKSPNAKKRYLQETASMYESDVAKADSHVFQQIQEKKKDIEKDSIALSMRDVGTDPMNDATAIQALKAAVGPAMASATSKENADAKAEAIRALLAKTRVEALLDSKETGLAELDKAAAIVKESEHALGEEGKKLMEVISERRGGVEVAGTAAAIVKASTRPDGSIDELKLADAVMKVPAERDMRKKVHAATEEVSAMYRRAYDAETNKLLSTAMRSYNVNGWWQMPEDLKKALNNRKDDPRGPDLYNRLQASALAKAKAAKGTKAQQDAWQKKENADALADFLSLSNDAQATIDIGPDGEFAQLHPNADIHGLKALGPHQKKAGDARDKGQSVLVDKFVGDVEGQLEAKLPMVNQNGKALSKDERAGRADSIADAKADARQAFHAWREKHNGEGPTAADTPNIVAPIILKYGGPPTSKADRVGKPFDPALEPEVAAEAQRLKDLAVPRPKVKTRPEKPAGKPTAKERAKQLQAEGKTKDEGLRIMKAEGY